MACCPTAPSRYLNQHYIVRQLTPLRTNIRHFFVKWVEYDTRHRLWKCRLQYSGHFVSTSFKLLHEYFLYWFYSTMKLLAKSYLLSGFVYVCYFEQIGIQVLCYKWITTLYSWSPSRNHPAKLWYLRGTVLLCRCGYLYGSSTLTFWEKDKKKQQKIVPHTSSHRGRYSMVGPDVPWSSANVKRRQFVMWIAPRHSIWHVVGRTQLLHHIWDADGMGLGAVYPQIYDKLIKWFWFCNRKT